MTTETTAIPIDPDRIAKALFLVIAALAVASMIGQYGSHMHGHSRMKGLVPLFNLDAESNIPTLYSAFLLLSSSLLTALIADLSYRIQASFRLNWAILSIGFAYMAIDEFVQLHERLIGPMRSWLGTGPADIFFFTWVVPGIIVVIIIGLGMIPFLRALPAPTRRGFVFAACLYVGGAIGMELIDGAYKARFGDNYIYSVLATVEEILELAGVVVFIKSLLDHIGRTYGDLTIQLSQPHPD